MASQGPLPTGTGADDSSIGTITWNNPGNIVSENGVTASAGPGLGSTYVSHYLKGTNFGFSIPAGATINGIMVEIKRAGDNGAGQDLDNSVKIIKAGTISGTDKASATLWPINSAYAYATYGSSSDLWGLAWTSTDINASNFGVALSSKSDGSSGNNNPAVDHMRITVTYTPVFSSIPRIQTRQAIKRASFY